MVGLSNTPVTYRKVSILIGILLARRRTRCCGLKAQIASKSIWTYDFPPKEQAKTANRWCSGWMIMPSVRCYRRIKNATARFWLIAISDGATTIHTTGPNLFWYPAVSFLFRLPRQQPRSFAGGCLCFLSDEINLTTRMPFDCGSNFSPLNPIVPSGPSCPGWCSTLSLRYC